MSVFNVIGFLLIAGISISAVAAGSDGCNKEDLTTKRTTATKCIAKAIKKAEGEKPTEWKNGEYCEEGNVKDLKKCVSDYTDSLKTCFDDTDALIDKIDLIAEKIINYTCTISSSNSTAAQYTKLIQQKGDLLLVADIDLAKQEFKKEKDGKNPKVIPNIGYTDDKKCLDLAKVKTAITKALANNTPNPDVELYTNAIIGSINAATTCEQTKDKTSRNPSETTAISDHHNDTQTPATNPPTTTTPKSSGSSLASGINVTLLIAAIATYLPGYF